MKKYDIMILSGGFDPIHKGHIRMFKAAKNMAHKVIVGLNSDKWLIRKKDSVFMNYAERAEILNAIKYIDEIVAFNDDDESAMDLLIRVQNLYPNCNLSFGNGGDRTEKNVPEKGYCDAYKIDLVYNVGGGKIQSSSELINKRQNILSAEHIEMKT
jgi:cytidyltransferase-like protein